MDFQLLHTRLLALLRARVRNGEITERALARITGVSQPHLHNALKGARLLSTAMADQILARLRIDLVDLLTAPETLRSPYNGSLQSGACRTVTLLDGTIGPGYPYPQAIGRSGYPFHQADVDPLQSPVAAWLAPDPCRPAAFNGAGVVLLDCSAGPRFDPHEDAYFALDLDGASTIGRVRRDGLGWCLWVHQSATWQPIPHAPRSSLDLIKGRVHLVVHRVQSI